MSESGKPKCCDKSGRVNVVRIEPCEGEDFKADITTQCQACGARYTYQGCVPRGATADFEHPGIQEIKCATVEVTESEPTFFQWLEGLVFRRRP